MMLKIKETVFVFDLDDTLYDEIDYHASGVKSVSNLLKEVLNYDAEPLLNRLISSKDRDLWDAVCKHLNFPDSFKESLLWHYRLHKPRLSLTPEVRELLDHLLEFSAGVAILTDGRVVTQRMKLSALDLDHITAYISEEFGAMKPDPVRFKLVASQYSGCEFVYIGDNPKKDFITPNQLGWTTFGLRDNGRNVHPQDINGLQLEYFPQIWLSSLDDLRKYL